MSRKFMRMMVFFDLPTITSKNRKDANTFRKFLVKDGYHMVQLSVYARVCNGLDSVEKHRQRLDSNLPEEGAVRMLVITEQQYNNIALLVGKPTKYDENQKLTQLSFF